MILYELRSSQGMLEATQRGMLCIMISKGEPSILGPNECVFDIVNFSFQNQLNNHLDLGWTGLVSMGAMFFLPFLGTGHSKRVDSFCRVNARNTFNKNIASFIGNPSLKNSLSNQHTNSNHSEAFDKRFF